MRCGADDRPPPAPAGANQRCAVGGSSRESGEGKSTKSLEWVKVCALHCASLSVTLVLSEEAITVSTVVAVLRQCDGRPYKFTPLRSYRLGQFSLVEIKCSQLRSE